MLHFWELDEVKGVQFYGRMDGGRPHSILLPVQEAWLCHATSWWWGYSLWLPKPEGDRWVEWKGVVCYHAQRVIYSKAGTLFWDDLGSFRWQGGALTHSITHWQWMSVSQSVCVSVCMCVCVLMLVCLCLLSVWLCVFVWMSAVPCEKEPPLDKLCQMTSVNVFHCMSESRWVIKTVDLIFLFSAKKHL